MHKADNARTVAAGLQWFFFIFTNTIVVPISIGEAFELQREVVIAMVQVSFLLTGLAGIIQGLYGHRLPIMEGHSGFWWGTILNLAYAAASMGLSLQEVGGSLSVGVMISGALIFILGISGLGMRIARVFNPVVMGVFMLLLGTQLTTIFFKGMLGVSGADSAIDLPIAGVSLFIAFFAAILHIKGSELVSRFSLLISITVGWLLVEWLVPDATVSMPLSGSWLMPLFPLGEPAWHIGIILTVILAGLLNTSNTIGALKGLEEVTGRQTTPRQYRASFAYTGIFSILSGPLGMVPYAPYVSSIGFLRSTRIYERAPFILGSAMFFSLGLVPAMGRFFSTLPVSIGNAVLFIAYLQLMGSALRNLHSLPVDFKMIYRVAAPAFIGIAIMTLPPAAFSSMPGMLRPLAGNGLLIGLLLSLVLENLVKWEKVSPVEK